MPIEVKSLEELEKIAQKGIECRVKRNNKDGMAKIKVRTNKYLYTFKVEKDKVDEILTKLNCKNVVDLDKQKPKQQKPKKKEEKKEVKEEAKEEVKGGEEKKETKEEEKTQTNIASEEKKEENQ
ncbi:Ribosomal L38e protein family [Caldisphaera lagunensis DSM 15908]|uniref:Ribosomal L38e protein family n=1 Tax=Caldisphaera lagunensis (strain DSM 15908 / JCM 11604 / ANMR 0165 / IC-154) TaxID=1056495 RepID=L0A9J7_CALLD|nr:50S ribosomal protein L38e [Caldisphaera lagunensis]AFZ69807.1 Ribosomal L38e protein family [Caldisphaera lagunensis DSM 15908]